MEIVNNILLKSFCLMIKFIYTGLRFIHDSILHENCWSRYEAQSPHACGVSASVNDMVSMLTANDRGAARPRARSTARGSTRSVRDRVRLSRLSLLPPPHPHTTTTRLPSIYNNHKPPTHTTTPPLATTTHPSTLGHRARVYPVRKNPGFPGF